MTSDTDRSVGEPDQLIAAAVSARAQAYAPYSNFSVGAAALFADGRISTGANVENASYGATVCAERVAIWRAVADGARDLVAIAVCAATSHPVAPCGMCRQVIHEFAAASGCTIYMTNTAGDVSTTSIAELLPHGFVLPKDRSRTRDG